MDGWMDRWMVGRMEGVSCEEGKEGGMEGAGREG